MQSNENMTSIGLFRRCTAFHLYGTCLLLSSVILNGRTLVTGFSPIAPHTTGIRLKKRSAFAIKNNGIDRPKSNLNAILPPEIASVLAGSVAGAIGVGIAFPLDTLKTKSQILGSASLSTQGVAAVSTGDNGNTNLLQLVRFIYRTEGLSGFFGGVRGMMAGQACIKAVAFSANSNAISTLERYSDVYPVLSNSFYVLILAASFSGFVTSFLVAPVERVKVMMQANSGTGIYKNELECMRAVLNAEGLEGLMGRGLGTTLAREIPSYAIYFVTYGVLIQTPFAEAIGGAAPLLFGALSGCACWLPVYPIDVVKTLVQNTESEDIDAWQVSKELYQEGGVGAFFDGLTPKMARAAVNHAVTFYIYGIGMSFLTDNYHT